MDETTFDQVSTFLALNRKNNKTENCDIIYATLVVRALSFFSFPKFRGFFIELRRY
jgi:hypothetical protein